VVCDNDDAQVCELSRGVDVAAMEDVADDVTPDAVVMEDVEVTVDEEVAHLQIQ